MSRRTRLTHVRRRRPFASADAPDAPGAAHADILHEETVAAPSFKPLMGTAKLKEAAWALWAPDYTPLFQLELEQNRLAVGGDKRFALPPSTYRQRLKGRAAERYDQRLEQQERDQLAIALHANNQQHWSYSLLARSVTYFYSTTDTLKAIEGRQ